MFFVCFFFPRDSLKNLSSLLVAQSHTVTLRHSQSLRDVKSRSQFETRLVTVSLPSVPATSRHEIVSPPRTG